MLYMWVRDALLLGCLSILSLLKPKGVWYFEPMKCPTKIRVDFLCKRDLEYTTRLGSFHKNKIKNIWVEFSKNVSIQHVRVTFSKNDSVKIV